MKRRAPAKMKRYLQRLQALRTLRQTPKAPVDVGGRADDVLGAVRRTASDVRTFGGRRHSQKRMRTQGLTTLQGKTGMFYDPAESLSYRIRRALTAPARAPIKQIDPKTDAILWYFDAETRRRWQDAACTIPYVEPPR